MKWTGLNELREEFLSFFEEKDHHRFASAPLVPQEDASLLLINSGMAPLKKYFLGVATPPKKRATSCQKCIRTPDIERVGKTSRHGTYFEMLGNFSFGDYFKHEATAWAWEFITKRLDLPVDRLWVSIYQDDDQAFEIWTKNVGVSPDRIVRLGKADNFWEIGAGPCGPCSEIYFDRGQEHGCDSPTCAVGCDCDRYVEFWNLVFTQFNSDGKGTYTPLAKPNIDTGMGLERLACIMQGVGNLFEVDTVQKIMNHVCQIAKVEYRKDAKTDVSLRVITDHIRSTTFMIGDGVVPQNEGRGYVLRRLLRRAARHGRMLGVTQPFLYKVCETVMQENESAYPDLLQNKDYIVKVIQVEEERFSKTIDQGMELLNNLIEKAKGQKTSVLSGEEAFKLYDTFGFPIDLTREIVEEIGMTVNEDEFATLMDQQRQRARSARGSSADVGWVEDVLAGKDLACKFVGYNQLSAEATVLAIISDGQVADAVGSGDEATIVLNQTPFYAESGGQVGDMGILQYQGGQFMVQDCKKSANGLFLHVGIQKTGSLSTGATVTAQVDAQRRGDITRNHTSCHLLQKALRDVLGEHVHQSGSMVDDQVCRFDFSHFSAVKPEELAEVERIVNDQILAAMDVDLREMSIKDAKAMGAMALFGEKYGDTVRVCNIGGWSIELCGGCHVSNIANLGLFKILKESSVAAGIRRIEATTGRGVLRLIEENNKLMLATASNLKLGNVAELPAKSAAMVAELRDKDKELESLEAKLADSKIQGLFENAISVGDIRVIAAGFMSVKPDALRVICDKVRENAPDAVAIITSTFEGKASIAVGCGKEALAKGLHAGKLIKELLALIGGSGGGRPDSAMGGTTEIFKIDEMMAKAPAVIAQMLEGK